MKFRVFIVFLFFVCCLLPGISLAQNKVVVIPLSSGDCDCNEIQTVTSANGRVWMDRNLGAVRVAQSVDDYHAYGYLYQWGRLADGHEDRGSDTTTTLSTSSVPGHDDFITVSASPNDWRSPQHHFLWSSIGGNIFINNPCPTGFRVPTETEWVTERASWSSIDAAGAFASPLKLTVAGNRHRSDGAVGNVGSGGYYWSRTVDDIYARQLTIGVGSGMYSSFRAMGHSVRCIKY